MKFNINFTNSKLAADVIILAAIVYAFIYKDATIFISGVTIGAGLLGWKQQKVKETKKIENKLPR